MWAVAEIGTGLRSWEPRHNFLPSFKISSDGLNIVHNVLRLEAKMRVQQCEVRERGEFEKRQSEFLDTNGPGHCP